MTAQEIINEIHKLPPTARKEVLDLLIEQPENQESDDLQIQELLFNAGLLQQIKPPRQRRIGDFSAVKVDGEPISETIIRERR